MWADVRFSQIAAYLFFSWCINGISIFSFSSQSCCLISWLNMKAVYDEQCFKLLWHPLLSSYFPCSGTRYTGFFCAMPTACSCGPCATGQPHWVYQRGAFQNAWIQPPLPKVLPSVLNFALISFTSCVPAAKAPCSLGNCRGHCLSSLPTGLHRALPAGYHCLIQSPPNLIRCLLWTY